MKEKQPPEPATSDLPPPPSYEDVMRRQGSASLYPRLDSACQNTTNSSSRPGDSNASGDPSNGDASVAVSVSGKGSSKVSSAANKMSRTASNAGVGSADAIAIGDVRKANMCMKKENRKGSNSSCRRSSSVVSNEIIGGEVRLALITPAKPFARPPKQPESNTLVTTIAPLPAAAAASEDSRKEQQEEILNVTQQFERLVSVPSDDDEPGTAGTRSSLSSSRLGLPAPSSGNSLCRPLQDEHGRKSSLVSRISSSSSDDYYSNQIVDIGKVETRDPATGRPQRSSLLSSCPTDTRSQDNKRLETKANRLHSSCPVLGTRSVSFGNIEIKEYPRAIGDNPGATSGGPPVSLGWKLVSARTLELEAYENHRMFNRRKREEMLVPPRVREVSLPTLSTHACVYVSAPFAPTIQLISTSNLIIFVTFYQPSRHHHLQNWLRKAGYGSSEIHQSIKSAARVRRQRERSSKGSIVIHDIQTRAREAFRFLKPRFCTSKDKKRRKVASSIVEQQDNSSDIERDPLDCSMRCFDARNL